MNLDTTETIYIAAESIVGLINIVGNFVVLLAILKTPKLHTVPNVFIVNLTIADILVGLFVCPSATIAALDISMEFMHCLLLTTPILVFTNASILCLVGVSFERFFAIKKPYRYQAMLTVRRAIFINVLIWLISLLFGLVPMYGWHGDKDQYVGRCYFTSVITIEYMVYFQAVVMTVIPMAVNICVYAYIMSTVHKHELYHRTQRNSVCRLSDQQIPSHGKLKKDVRAAKLFISINVLFAVSWLPLNIINCIALFCPECPGANQPRNVMFVLIVLSHANSSINPFLYAYSNTSIRNAVLRLCGSRRRGIQDNTSNDPESNRSRTTSRRGTDPSPVLHKMHNHSNDNALTNLSHHYTNGNDQNKPQNHHCNDNAEINGTVVKKRVSYDLTEEIDTLSFNFQSPLQELTTVVSKSGANKSNDIFHISMESNNIPPTNSKEETYLCYANSGFSTDVDIQDNNESIEPRDQATTNNGVVLRISDRKREAQVSLNVHDNMLEINQTSYYDTPGVKYTIDNTMVPKENSSIIEQEEVVVAGDVCNDVEIGNYLYTQLINAFSEQTRL